MIALLCALWHAMFSIVPNPTFTADVNLSVPGSDQPQRVGFTFRHKRSRELSAWLGGSGAAANDAELLGQVIVDWSGIGAEDGKPIPYTQHALEMLLDAYPSAGTEIVLAYLRQLRDARAKN